MSINLPYKKNKKKCKNVKNVSYRHVAADVKMCLTHLENIYCVQLHARKYILCLLHARSYSACSTLEVIVPIAR